MFGVVGVVGVLNGSRDVLANILEGGKEVDSKGKRRKRRKKNGATNLILSVRRGEEVVLDLNLMARGRR